MLSLLLMTVTFVSDSPSQTLNYDLYYEDESKPDPVTVPIGSNDSSFLSSLSSGMDTVYSDKFDIQTNVASTVKNFDKNFLFPIK